VALKVDVKTEGLREAVEHYRGAREKIGRVIVRASTEAGEQMRTYVVRTYRSIRSATSTGRISGNLAASYGYEVKPEGQAGATLGFGLLRSSAQADALVYGPVHEFGATIRAKSGGRLKFRLADGSWRSAKSVRIPARPAIEPTARYYAPVLERVLADRLVETIR